MALISIDKLSRIEKERNSVHNPVYASYTSFIEDNKHYFQIDTYGSENRKCIGHASQYIQFDEETAKALIDILKKEFNL